MSTNPRQLGKYELRERLGSGGMAEVWKGFDTQLHRYVAIKIMHANLQNDPEFITRFVREARAIASLHHPNIVQIYDFQAINPSESSNSLAYMVMDYVEGQTLAEFLRHSSGLGKSLSAAEIVNLFASISRAIDYAHRHDMIHRDIKPANILLDKRNTTNNPMGEPILSDFGIAKLIGVASGTVTGTWLGTPMYTSPEQVQGQPGNVRGDIYSLGIILYEICTGCCRLYRPIYKCVTHRARSLRNTCWRQTGNLFPCRYRGGGSYTFNYTCAPNGTRTSIYVCARKKTAGPVHRLDCPGDSCRA